MSGATAAMYRKRLIRMFLFLSGALEMCEGRQANRVTSGRLGDRAHALHRKRNLIFFDPGVLGRPCQGCVRHLRMSRGRIRSGTSMSDIAETEPSVAPRAKGRSDAIEPFIRAHTGGIRRALTRSGLREEDARDALQDVLSVFARRFSSIEPGAERAFLTATARRVAADYRRKSRAEQSVGEHADELAPAVPFEERALDYDLDLRRAHTEVVDALCVLPRVERELFVLGCWQGKSRVEVAAELGIPEGTVASRL